MFSFSLLSLDVRYPISRVLYSQHSQAFTLLSPLCYLVRCLISGGVIYLYYVFNSLYFHCSSLGSKTLFRGNPGTMFGCTFVYVLESWSPHLHKSAIMVPHCIVISSNLVCQTPALLKKFASQPDSDWDMSTDGCAVGGVCGITMK